jgi:hypothetical protein
MREQNARDPCELLARTGLQRRAPGIEQHVGQVDNESARAFACIEHLVELLPKLAAKCGPVALGLRRDIFGLLCLRLRAALSRSA